MPEEKSPRPKLVDRAKEEGLVHDYTHDNTPSMGESFARRQIHATTLGLFSPVMAAMAIATSHKLVAELFTD